MDDVETALSRITSFKDVLGIMIIDGDGKIIKSTIQEEVAEHKYRIHIPSLAAMARSFVREIHPQNDLQMLRIKSYLHELIILVDWHFTLVLIQDYLGLKQEPPTPPTSEPANSRTSISQASSITPA